MLQDTSGRGEHHVRRGRGDDDQINVLGSATGGIEGLFAGLKSQVAAVDIGGCKVTCANTCALNDPLI